MPPPLHPWHPRFLSEGLRRIHLHLGPSWRNPNLRLALGTRAVMLPQHLVLESLPLLNQSHHDRTPQVLSASRVPPRPMPLLLALHSEQVEDPTLVDHRQARQRRAVHRLTISLHLRFLSEELLLSPRILLVLDPVNRHPQRHLRHRCLNSAASVQTHLRHLSVGTLRYLAQMGPRQVATLSLLELLPVTLGQ